MDPCPSVQDGPHSTHQDVSGYLQCWVHIAGLMTYHMTNVACWVNTGQTVGKNSNLSSVSAGARDKVIIITCHIICSFVHSPLFIPSHLSSMRTVIIIGAPDGPRVFCRGLSRLGQQDQINLTGVDSNYTYMGIGKTYGPKLILSTPGKT